MYRDNVDSPMTTGVLQKAHANIDLLMTTGVYVTDSSRLLTQSKSETTITRSVNGKFNCITITARFLSSLHRGE